MVSVVFGAVHEVGGCCVVERVYVCEISCIYPDDLYTTRSAAVFIYAWYI